LGLRRKRVGWRPFAPPAVEVARRCRGRGVFQEGEMWVYGSMPMGDSSWRNRLIV
jgi:hypothetical protein